MNRMGAHSNLVSIIIVDPGDNSIHFFLGPRRNLELMQKLCSADIICRVNLFVIFQGQALSDIDIFIS